MKLSLSDFQADYLESKIKCDVDSFDPAKKIMQQIISGRKLSEQPKRDNWRSCPDCNIEMECKSSPNEDFLLYQCSECKRIEEEYWLKKTFK